MKVLKDAGQVLHIMNRKLDELRDGASLEEKKALKR